MNSSRACPTEDAVQIFLDYLVDPMLPARSSSRATPSIDQQISVAKQVHAVVLLYNYYHRKQHPQLEFLNFESFCKLSGVLKPPLLTFMKLMQRSDDIDLDDLDKQISIIEKSIMNACDICSSLDPSKNAPQLEGWPISKVAVFLVDSNEENCLLQFCSITQGVWSVIEKDVDTHKSVDDTVTLSSTNKKKKIIKRSLNASSVLAEAELTNIAFSAVKDATGINKTDLCILEKHDVHSLSKEKTRANFYIMRCTQVINEDVSQVPIQDVIDSLQGPLVKNSSRSWSATQAVEYFHVLPYAEIISQWISRDKTLDSFQEQYNELINARTSDSVMTETYCDIEIVKNTKGSNGNACADVEMFNKKTSPTTYSKQKDNEGYCINDLPNNKLFGVHNMDANGSYVVSPRHEEKQRILQIPDNAIPGADSSEVCPTEDAVQLFLDYLVDPMLPASSSARITPSIDLQMSVAKQVHAAVLLYNYYHKKQHPWLEFLNFDSFCKLAGVLKPPLLTFMNHDNAGLDDLDKQNSITEKKIKNACDICFSLDVSKDVPLLDGWPISKVAVFLVDLNEENCLLQFCAVTQGVWSVIEKDIDMYSVEDSLGANNTNKKKKIAKRSIDGLSAVKEDDLLKLAFSAVKGATGINQNGLLIMGSHIVYSLSKEKSAAKFYIMRCTQEINADVSLVPIRDLTDSLQGPLVKKSARCWIATPVVEYFHVLPYAEIILQWISRDKTLDSFQEKNEDLISLSVSDSVMTATPCDIEVEKSIYRTNGKAYEKVEVFTQKNSPKISPKQKDCKGYYVNDLFITKLSGKHNMDVDRFPVVSPQYKDDNKIIPDSTVSVVQHKKVNDPSLGNDQILSKGFKADKVNSVLPCTNEHVIEKCPLGNKTCKTVTTDHDENLKTGHQALEKYQCDSKHLSKLHTLLSAKNTSETALNFLLKKRDNLTQQQRNIEDEIAQCNKNINIILSGGENALEVQIESIIEGCNSVCLSSSMSMNIQDRANQYQPFEGQISPRCVKRKQLSEAILTKENPTQELDNICYKNNWVLPTYCVRPLDGGFKGEVNVKGEDFDFSCSGDLDVNPREARESAALQMLNKLRSVQ